MADSAEDFCLLNIFTRAVFTHLRACGIFFARGPEFLLSLHIALLYIRHDIALLTFTLSRGALKGAGPMAFAAFATV